jgi:hypothetical protein
MLVVHRPYNAVARSKRGDEGGDPAEVQVLVRKVRNKMAGKIGEVRLRYDRTVGTYVDYGDE